MSDFFHGWRRKAGCALLVMALVLFIAWMRSLTIRDIVSVPMDNLTMQSIGILHGSFSWISMHEEEEAWIPVSYSWQSDRIPTNEPHPLNDPRFTWHWQYCGFGCGRSIAYPDEVYVLLWVFPCWSVVAPLTLLSAYLLLWPSQRKSKPQTSQPTE